MASAKIAITVPEEVLKAVDEEARRRGDTRSGFITRILRTALKARRDAEITRRLDEPFAEAPIAAEQLRTMREMDSGGHAWSEEGWD